MSVPADLDLQIATLEAELASLKRQRAEWRDQVFLLILERDVHPGVVFSVQDLIHHSTVHRELAEAIGDATPVALGRRLARIARRADVAGLTLQCLGRTEEGCIWEVQSTA